MASLFTLFVFTFFYCFVRFDAVLATTVYMAGDSTMAKGGGGSGTDGVFSAFILSVQSYLTVVL